MVTLYSKRILITGGAGFIGSHLLRHLIYAGCRDVTVLDNFWRGQPNGTSNCLNRVRLVEGDVRDCNALRVPMTGIDVVFHLAAQANVMGAVKDPEYAFSTNVIGTFNVLKMAAECRVKRVIFTSSREVYGEVNSLPVAEDAPLNPKNAYGVSKLAGELYCRLEASSGTEVVVLRLGNVYGPGDRDRVIPLFIGKARRSEPLTIFGKNKIIDFIWVGHVVEALLQSATRDVAGQVINIGSGQGTSLTELASTILKLTRSQSPLHFASTRSEEVDRYVADLRKAAVLLGYRPHHDPLHRLADVVEDAEGVAAD